MSGLVLGSPDRLFRPFLPWIYCSGAVLKLCSQ